MLLNLHTLFDKYSMNVRGVIQVGAHKGQEYNDYRQHGVIDIVFIEPGPSYNDLLARFGGSDKVKLFNTACGDGTEGGEATAYVENVNQGMSSSLLAPKVHLTQHYDIPFPDRAVWKVCRLDDLDIDRSMYNMLNMDVQGYEDRVLRGATETLKHIDYIYSEVNRQEMYENCAMIDQLQEYLVDFRLVEVGWASEYHGWGDGFWIRKTLLVS